MTVDKYLENLLPEQQLLLKTVRKAIKATCPDAEEIISYGMPGYKYLGYPLVYFAAYKNHCSLFGSGKRTLADLKNELSQFKIVGSTLHFTPEKPLTSTLVKKLIKARMKENEEKISKSNKGGSK